MTLRRRVIGGAAVVVALLAVAVAILVRGGGDEPPAEDSVDVGFARDMRVHHAQAVQLTELLRFRTGDEDMRRLAADIGLGQQSQIGQMRGWLDTWGRTPTSVEPPMQWMDHPAGEPMPGLAGDEEIARLTAAQGVDAEVLFLELMIRHHEGGIHMAQLAAERAEEPYVRTLAHGMAEAQAADIATMTDLLADRGVRYGGG